MSMRAISSKLFKTIPTIRPLTSRVVRSVQLPHRQIFQVPARRWASSVNSPSIATVDPAQAEATSLLEHGTKLLEEGDIEGALKSYARSVEINRTASGLFNLGVTHYHLKQFDKAIECWKAAIEIDPTSADAHTNLASAYIMSPPSRPQLALEHLQIAASLAPEDGEIAFNLAAVLEACGQLEAALVQYKRSLEFNVERAEQNIRNVSAKIFGQRLNAAAADQTSPGSGEAKDKKPSS
ncbi:TPR-like protein [Serendipita vermifera]|nr:TPR-like protein [Serendipita vermifera]